MPWNGRETIEFTPGPKRKREQPPEVREVAPSSPPPPRPLPEPPEGYRWVRVPQGGCPVPGTKDFTLSPNFTFLVETGHPFWDQVLPGPKPELKAPVNLPEPTAVRMNVDIPKPRLSLSEAVKKKP